MGGALEFTIEWELIKNWEVPEEIAKIIASAVLKRGEKAPLLLAMMQVESSFNPYAKSKTGCLGLLQIQPKIWSISPQAARGIESSIRQCLQILQIYGKEALFKYTRSWKAVGRILRATKKWEKLLA